MGLWHVQLFLDPRAHTTASFETYKQWHSDGLESESANVFPGAACVGTWRQIAHNTAQLYHVGWTYGTPAVPPTSVRFVVDGDKHGQHLTAILTAGPVRKRSTISLEIHVATITLLHRCDAPSAAVINQAAPQTIN